jgi:hypothetical protein
MREFKTIDSAESADKLRMRLKDQELEQYGDSITPEYVYDTIKQLPRFSSMRRGHQQDAEEFLGFLLDGIHDECMTVMRKAGVDSDDSAQPASPGSTTSGANTDAGWLEVGPKQKQSVTRQSGESLSTPITRVFGGSLRSELRVPGLKNSVTMEPYQPLQLDIGAPDVNNIIQALKAITKPETLTGDFGSPRGPGTTAVKQVFIESLPPVLILHLKRLQFRAVLPSIALRLLSTITARVLLAVTTLSTSSDRTSANGSVLMTLSSVVSVPKTWQRVVLRKILEFWHARSSSTRPTRMLPSVTCSKVWMVTTTRIVCAAGTRSMVPTRSLHGRLLSPTDRRLVSAHHWPRTRAV